MEISKFIIGTLAVSLVLSLVLLGMAELNAVYSISDYNDSRFSDYNQLSDLRDLANKSRDQTLDVQDESEGTSEVGLIGSTMFVLKSATQSIDTFRNITSTALSKSPLGESGTILYSHIMVMVTIAVILGGVVAAIMKYRT